MYAAQVTPPIDAEIAEKGHLWTETSSPPVPPTVGREPRRSQRTRTYAKRQLNI